MRIELEIIIKYFIADEYLRELRSCSKTSSVGERSDKIQTLTVYQVSKK